MKTEKCLLLFGLILAMLVVVSCATTTYEVMLQGAGERTEQVTGVGKQSYSLPERQMEGFKLISIKDSRGEGYSPDSPDIQKDGTIELTYSWAEVHQVKDGDGFTIPEKTRKGFSLVSVTDGQGNVYQPGQSITVGDNLVLTYNWKEDVECLVRCVFDMPEGAAPAGALSFKRPFGGKFVLPADEESAKDRKPRILQFAGITDSNGAAFQPGEEVDVAGDAEYTYHYEWKKAPVVLVGYDHRPEMRNRETAMEFDVGSLVELAAPAASAHRALRNVVDMEGHEYKVGKKYMIPDKGVRLVFNWDDVYEVVIAGLDSEVELTRSEKQTFTVPKQDNEGFKLMRIADKAGATYEVGDRIEKDSSIDLTYTWAQVFKVRGGERFVVPELSREGYVLASITDGAGSTYEPGTTIVVHGDMTLAYNWAKRHTTTILGIGPDPIVDEKVDGEILVLPVAARQGFALASIKDAEGNAYQPMDSIVVRNDLVVTYEWTGLTTARVEGLAGGPRFYKLPAGKRIVLPKVEREGYALGSVRDADGNLYTPGAEYAVPDKDITIIYSWLKVHNVSVSSVEDEEIVSVEQEGAFTVLPKERNGFKLAGIKDSEGRSYEPGSKIKSSKTIRLTYSWVETIPVVDGDFFEVPEKTRKGFKLVSITDGAGCRYNCGDKIKVASDISLSYNWAEVCSVTLLGLGDGPEVVQTFAGDRFVVPSASKDGCVLVDVSDAMGAVHKPGQSIVVSGSMVLTYNWARDCKVVLAGLGKAPEVYHLAAGSKAAIPDRSREGYEIGGVVDDFGNVYMPNQIVTVPDTDVTLVYNWLKKRKITLTGLEKDEEILVADGRPFHVPSKARKGHNLVGITDGAGRTYNVGNEIIVGSDLKLRYSWERMYPETKWNESEIEKVCSSLVRRCLSSSALTRYEIENLYAHDTVAPYVPVIEVGLFTGVPKDDADMVAEKMQSEILASGKVYLAAVPGDGDFILQGWVREDRADSGDFEEVKTYIVTAQLVSTETGYVVWQESDSQISKRYFKTEE